MSRASTSSPRGAPGGGVTVPVLVTPDGVLADSAEILAWVDERTPPEHRLFPAEPQERREVERLCRRLDDELGPKGRRLMYVHMLAHRKLMLALQQRGRAALGGPRIRVGWPIVVRFARRVLGIRAGSRSRTRPCLARARLRRGAAGRWPPGLPLRPALRRR